MVFWVLPALWMLQCCGFLSWCRHPTAVVECFCCEEIWGWLFSLSDSPDRTHWLSLIMGKGNWLILFCSCSSLLSNCCVCPHLSLWGGQLISTNISLSLCSHMRGYLREHRDAPSHRVFKWTQFLGAVPVTQYPCTSRRWSQVSTAIASAYNAHCLILQGCWALQNRFYKVFLNTVA